MISLLFPPSLLARAGHWTGHLFFSSSKSASSCLELFRIKFEIGNKDSSQGVIYTFLMAFINFKPNLVEKSDSESFDQIRLDSPL